MWFSQNDIIQMLKIVPRIYYTRYCHEICYMYVLICFVQKYDLIFAKSLMKNELFVFLYEYLGIFFTISIYQIKTVNDHKKFLTPLNH